MTRQWTRHSLKGWDSGEGGRGAALLLGLSSLTLKSEVNCLMVCCSGVGASFCLLRGASVIIDNWSCMSCGYHYVAQKLMVFCWRSSAWKLNKVSFLGKMNKDHSYCIPCAQEGSFLISTINMRPYRHSMSTTEQFLKYWKFLLKIAILIWIKKRKLWSLAWLLGNANEAHLFDNVAYFFVVLRFVLRVFILPSGSRIHRGNAVLQSLP